MKRKLNIYVKLKDGRYAKNPVCQIGEGSVFNFTDKGIVSTIPLGSGPKRFSRDIRKHFSHTFGEIQYKRPLTSKQLLSHDGLFTAISDEDEFLLFTVFERLEWDKPELTAI